MRRRRLSHLTNESSTERMDTAGYEGNDSSIPNFGGVIQPRSSGARGPHRRPRSVSCSNSAVDRSPSAAPRQRLVCPWHATSVQVLVGPLFSSHGFVGIRAQWAYKLLAYNTYYTYSTSSWSPLFITCARTETAREW